MKSQLRRVPGNITYANVVASLALFIALGGVSYAAVKLPANSVGTKQLKNGSVTTKKLNRRTLASLKGSTGPTGAQGGIGPKGTDGAAGADGADGADGSTGATGATGAAGPSDVTYNAANLDSQLLVDDQDNVVQSQNLPAGDYLVQALGQIGNTIMPFDVERRTDCSLVLDDGEPLFTAIVLNGAFNLGDVSGSSGATETIAMQAAITVADSSTVEVICRPFDGDTRATVSLSALRVGAINN